MATAATDYGGLTEDQVRALMAKRYKELAKLKEERENLQPRVGLRLTVDGGDDAYVHARLGFIIRRPPRKPWCGTRCLLLTLLVLCASLGLANLLRAPPQSSSHLRSSIQGVDELERYLA